MIPPTFKKQSPAAYYCQACSYSLLLDQNHFSDLTETAQKSNPKLKIETIAFFMAAPVI